MKERFTAFSFHRRSYAEISLKRVADNFRTLRALLPEDAFFCPMVKANAYGHGDLEVARALRAAGAKHLGVGLIEEGMGLRLAGDRGGILLFGIFEESSADAILEFALSPVVSELHELESLSRAIVRRAHKGRVKIHLKFNTGMNRLGLDVDRADEARAYLDKNPQFELEGICTHLLRGDDAGSSGGESESQLAAFSKALAAFRGIPVKPHVLNSSALANLSARVRSEKPLSQGALWPVGARPGLAIYGAAPSNDEGAKLALKPALSLKSHLVMLHRLKVGERVSYNAIWRAERESLIGAIPVGYADGYFRSLSNKGEVLVKGLRAPVAGTVCMDYFMVDLTDVEKAKGPIKPGDEVVLIGEQDGAELTADEVAKWVGTIPYEIFTSISERVPRIYLR